jgi:NAD(P)-dependent dehydrogenase (short-subunit alcohol dehydrogenase family)
VHRITHTYKNNKGYKNFASIITTKTFDMNTDQIPASKEKIVGKENLEVIRKNYKGSEKLLDKVALITGGDSGIGRSVAVYFAREGADIVIVYHESDLDANQTQEMVESEGRKCILIKGDIASEEFCRSCVQQTVKQFSKIDILVNNAGTHEEDKEFLDITTEQFKRTFEVNMFSFFYFTHEAVKHMKENSCIINTASVVAYRGSEHLMDYSSTKGAVVSFTRAVSKNLAPKKIRVNGVAPGPIWTPLVIATFDEEHLKKFGGNTPMKRAGKPSEVAPAYVFLASEDSSYISGQMIHVNGGEVVGG